MLVLLLLGASVATLITPRQAQAIIAPDDHSVLILDSSVSGGAGSREAIEATSIGLTPVVVSDADWAATTGPEFASYRAIVLGDPSCQTGTASIAAAEANKGVWGPVVAGNVIIVGTDPVYHSYLAGAVTLINRCIAFAAAGGPGKTGAYICLSCYYYNAASGTAVPVLDPIGTFTVVGQGGCPANSHIIATHPALSGLTDADLSNWGCSTHEGFVSWPATFDPLAISRDVPSPFVAGDGSTGAPYIVARGATILSHICLTPGDATNPLDTDHTVTAFVNTLLDCTGEPVSGVLVTFLVVDGPNAGAGGSATTLSNGRTTFTYHGTIEGTDVIQASFLNEAGAREYTRAVKHWGGGCTGPGRIECPDNIRVRCTDPDGAVVEFRTPRAFDCSGKPLEVVCTKESGTWFHTGLTRIECFGPDDPSGDCLYCSFDVEVEPSNCPQPTAFWGFRLDLWPVYTLKLGCKTYDANHLLFFLSSLPGPDASLFLASNLVGAKLNLAHCTDPCPISEVVQAADNLIGDRMLPLGTPLTSPEGVIMLQLASYLFQYNEGILTPRCGPDKTTVQDVRLLTQAGFTFSLKSAAPNPFGRSTSMLFTLPTEMDARLSVFDLQGREVKVLANGPLSAGRHTAFWDGTDANGLSLPNGVYFARLTASGNRTLTQKMVKSN